MKMTGRRESQNVDDRRGLSSSAKGGLGIGGILIVIVIAWLTGNNPLYVLQNVDMGQIVVNQGQTDYQPTAEEEQMATFCKQIMASTEDVWNAEFKAQGLQYQEPTLVLFTGSVQSACGGATSAVGPFYCSGDNSVYIDLSFLIDMRKNLGAGGDLAYAYVLAHEVGHHVQNQLGQLQAAHNQMSKLSETESNKISVRLELQADYYAGLWVAREQKMFNSLEEGDIEDALGAAKVIGDDYLQKQAQGYAVPETFNHGTSDQRFRWLRDGINKGSLADAKRAFSTDYDAL